MARLIIAIAMRGGIAITTAMTMHARHDMHHLPSMPACFSHPCMLVTALQDEVMEFLHEVRCFEKLLTAW